MVVKQAQYNITKTTGEDVYHFETDDKMVQFLDPSKNSLGTLKEFALEGKVVTTGSFKLLKVSGLYKIKGVTGLPAGTPVDKISILSVRAVGITNAPEMISYELITESGAISHNTIFGAKETGWTNGGTSISNSINLAQSNIGTITSLNTTAKTNLVAALNEVNTLAKAVDTKATTTANALETYKAHKHDESYVAKSGGEITGDLVVASGKAVRGKKPTGEVVYLVGTSPDGLKTWIGQSSMVLDLYGKSITFGGKDVWHAGNHGAGSGLDADKLKGIDGGTYARKDAVAAFESDIKTANSIYVNHGLYFGESYDGRIAGIRAEANGRLNFTTGKTMHHSVAPDGRFESFQGHDLVASSKEANIVFKLGGSDKGMGFYRNTSSKYVGFWNWQTNKRVMYIGHEDNSLHVDEPIFIQGKRLFLQNSSPTGAKSVGDIWIS